MVRAKFFKVKAKFFTVGAKLLYIHIDFLFHFSTHHALLQHAHCLVQFISDASFFADMMKK